MRLARRVAPSLAPGWALLTSILWVGLVFIGGTADPVGPTMNPARAREVAAGSYTAQMIEGAGHWVQQERPEEVNRLLLGFLREVDR